MSSEHPDGLIVFEHLRRPDDEIIGNKKDVKLQAEPFVNKNAPSDFYDNDRGDCSEIRRIGRSVAALSKMIAETA